MSDPSLPAHLREFHCQHCNGKIRIPKDLPPTTAPCPHCHGTITSPAPEGTAPAEFFPPAPVSYAPPASPAPPAGPPASQPVAPAYQPEPVIHPPANYQPVEPAPPMPAPQDIAPVQIPQPRPAAEALRESSTSHEKPHPLSPEAAPKRRIPIEAPPQQKRSILPAVVLLGLLLALAGGAGLVVYKELKKRQATTTTVAPPVTPAMAEEQYLRIGWQKDAYSVLGKFLAGKTTDEKLPYILDGARLKSQIESFYGGSVIHDGDTPADAFSVYELTPEDHKRGLFMLMFDQPPLFDIKEFFRPLASLEVQWGVTEADMLLSTVARVDNFATEPLRVNAFFKRTPEGLKLDWETFAQTKYRTFQTFTEWPEPGQSAVFRVVIGEDVPDAANASNAAIRTYRITDPASPEVSARVNVSVDSPLGETLSEINWIKQQKRPINRTATVELKWTDGDRPRLEISRFLCWEFLNLGGQPVTAAPSR